MKILGGFLLLLAANAAVVERQSEPVLTVRGVVKCFLDGSYQPLPFMKIQVLSPTKHSSRRKVAEGQTGEHGDFNFPLGPASGLSPQKPSRPKVKLFYSYSGEYGNMEIEPLRTSRSFHQTSVTEDPVSVYFNIKLSNKYCRTYLRFYHNGLKYYYETVGRKPPYGTLYVQANEVLHGGVPYYTTYTIRLRKSWEEFDNIAVRHEFGHSVRQCYDGGYYHSVSDVMRYGYSQAGNCSAETNYGLAFNEGWAEYWADECGGNTGSNYKVEGNVASALRRLAAVCKTTKAKMVDVLRLNSEVIHSFCEFYHRHQSLYQCNSTDTACA